jgi:flagellar basal body-associated protein FliL
MFCKNCGKEIADDSAFCSKCGTKLSNNNPVINDSDDHSTEAMIGFALSLASLVFGVTLILPILGIYFSNKGKKSSKANFAKAGKVISIISLVGSIILLIAFLIITVATVIATSDILKNELETESIETSIEDDSVLAWYDPTDFWFVLRTNESNSAVVSVHVALGYSKNNKSSSVELKQKTIQITDELRNYFVNKTGLELRTQKEDVLKSEIKELINNKVLDSAKIEDVRFTQFDVHQYDF